MIAEVNRALTGLLEPLLPPGCEIHFGAPARGGKALSWFLADVREDEKAAETDWTDVRDDTGRVVARRPPVRRFDLHYLVTAEEDDPALLDAVLTAADPGRRVPAALLPAALAGHPVTLRLTGGPIAPADRTTLRVLVSAPLVLQPVTEVAPPAEDVRLGVAVPGGRPPAPPPPARSGRWRGSAVEEAGHRS